MCLEAVLDYFSSYQSTVIPWKWLENMLYTRWRVIYMSREERSTKDIAITLHVGQTFVKKIKRLFQENRSIKYRQRAKKTPKTKW